MQNIAKTCSLITNKHQKATISLIQYHGVIWKQFSLHKCTWKIEDLGESRKTTKLQEQGPSAEVEPNQPIGWGRKLGRRKPIQVAKATTKKKNICYPKKRKRDQNDVYDLYQPNVQTGGAKIWISRPCHWRVPNTVKGTTKHSTPHGQPSITLSSSLLAVCHMNTVGDWVVFLGC